MQYIASYRVYYVYNDIFIKLLSIFMEMLYGLLISLNHLNERSLKVIFLAEYECFFVIYLRFTRNLLTFVTTFKQKMENSLIINSFKIVLL